MPATRSTSSAPLSQATASPTNRQRRAGGRAHRERVGAADGAARLRTLRGPGRGLGSAVTSAIGAQDPEHCAGIHINMVFSRPDPETMGDLTEQEKGALAALKHYQDWDSGYSKQQSTRPRPSATASSTRPPVRPAGSSRSSGPGPTATGIPRTCSRATSCSTTSCSTGCGETQPPPRDSTGRASTRLQVGDVHVPTGCSIFPKEIMRASRRWAEGRYKNIVYWNELERGGHFAAFEQPEIFVEEVRSCFRHVRKTPDR